MSDGRVFATTLTEQEFKSGYQYNIKLKVGQDKVELGGITAAEWGEPVDGGMLENVPTDQTHETKWTEFDILWATGTAMSSSIEIEFKHLYTKFSVNLTYGTEVDATQTIESVTVGETYIVRNFNYASQTWGITLSDITDIKALALKTPNDIDANDESKGTYNASFEALILPQTAAPQNNYHQS